METELIQALSNVNINSESAEIIASEYMRYLYFSKIISYVSMTIILCPFLILVKCVFNTIREGIQKL
jgi:hypothetical protein